MVTLGIVPIKTFCGRPNCPTCYPVAVPVEEVEPVPTEEAPPKRTGTKAQQAKAAIALATGINAVSLDEPADASGVLSLDAGMEDAE